MTNNESVDDGTEGGYTAYSSEDFERWFNSLTTDKQMEFIAHTSRLGGPEDYLDGLTREQLEEEHRVTQELPDEELDELEYYGRHGYTRTAPVCTDPECGCRDDLEDGDE